MSRNKYHAGDCVGNFRLVKFSHITKSRRYYWLSKCLGCGNESILSLSSIVKGQKTCRECRNTSGRNNGSWRGIGDLSGSYFSNIKSQAKFRGIPFRISKNSLWKLFENQNKKCALSGIEINIEPSHTKAVHNQGTASLDRKDSSKGYVLKNVQWVHKDINYMKQRFSNSHFIQLCKKVAQFSK